MKVLDLFSGIGGFSLGLEMAGGFETVAFCEQDAFCQQVLRKHWPEVPIYDDITTLAYSEGAIVTRPEPSAESSGISRPANASVDVITGGFPCQPFSHAGKRRGSADDRALWPEMCRLVREVQPTWVIGENVAGIESIFEYESRSSVESQSDFVASLSRTGIRFGRMRGLRGRSYFNGILEDLESIGYSVQPFVIPACAVDAPHRRDRVWIVAHRTRIQSGRQEPRAGRQRTGAGGESVADANRNDGHELAKEAIRTGRDAAEPVCDSDSDSEPVEPIDAEASGVQRDAAGPVRWLPEPSVGRVADGVPRRVDRLKSLGNAVVPAVVQRIGEAILSTEKHT